eukprot:4181762-Amphidinium_carterae.1
MESMDLKEMFAALRCGVAPNVSLETFATRILSFYNSFAEAFAAISIQKAAIENTARTQSLVGPEGRPPLFPRSIGESPKQHLSAGTRRKE